MSLVDNIFVRPSSPRFFPVGVGQYERFRTYDERVAKMRLEAITRYVVNLLMPCTSTLQNFMRTGAGSYKTVKPSSRREGTPAHDTFSVGS
jgi:hypothetical protein